MRNRKEQITTIAQNMFRQNGYAATSMRHLAGLVGIEPASLYNHFRSKEEILKDICFRIADEYLAAIDAIDHSAPVLEQLQNALHNHLEVIFRNLDAAAVFLHEWRFMSEKNLKIFKQKRQQYEVKFIRILECGIREGLFIEQDVRLLAKQIFASMNWVYEWYRPDGHITASQLKRQIVNFILNAVVNHEKILISTVNH